MCRSLQSRSKFPQFSCVNWEEKVFREIMIGLEQDSNVNTNGSYDTNQNR